MLHELGSRGKKKTEQEIIAFDGKQSRNSGDKNNGKRAINMVSALAIENRLCKGTNKLIRKMGEFRNWSLD
jgi:hypothetical protein